MEDSENIIDVIEEEKNEEFSNDDLFNITSWGADPSVRELIMQYEEGDIEKPELQRKYVKFEDFLKQFEVPDKMIDEFVAAGEKQGIKKDENLLVPVVPDIKLFVKSLIARDLWGMNELYRVSNETNKILKAAVDALNDGTYERILK